MVQRDSSRPDRPRWRPRFSLRALLLLMLLIGVGIGWFVSRTRLAIRQQAAVERVRELGGHATFEYQMDARRRALGPPMPPAYLRKLTGDVVMSEVVKVSLHAPFAGDIDVLTDLPELRDLRLNMRHLTDDGLPPVANLKQLRRLDLWCEQLTDDALIHLSGLRRLRQLDLYSTQVTDAGLVHLRGLTNLEELKLRDTNVTPRGVAMLREALPQCRILGVDDRPHR